MLYAGETDHGALIVAKHTGYERISQPVVHVRGVKVFRDGRLMVWDYLGGAGQHNFEINWHVAPDRKLVRVGEKYQIQDRNCDLQIEIQGGTCREARGETDPILGWASIIYGTRFKISVLSCSSNNSAPHEFITLIAPAGNMLLLEHCKPYLEKMREFVQ